MKSFVNLQISDVIRFDLFLGLPRVFFSEEDFSIFFDIVVLGSFFKTSNKDFEGLESFKLETPVFDCCFFEGIDDKEIFEARILRKKFLNK